MGSQVALGLGVVALIVAVAAFLLATLANRRWARRARLTSSPAALRELVAAQQQLADQVAGLKDSLRSDLAGEAASQADAVQAIRGEVAGLSADVQDSAVAMRELEAVSRTSLRRVAVVRYDAFADVGGRLSYSVAVLDDTGSGLVLTALSGKSDTRTYVKAVSAGAGESPLTPEEEQAVAAAAGSTP